MIHLSNDYREIEHLKGSKPLIIFHWDADGIASTALLKKYLNLDPILYVPQIGFYDLDIDDIRGISGYRNIFIVDFGVNTGILEELYEAFGHDIYVFDHHHRRPSDKVKIFKYMVDGSPYPSESIMVTELLGIEPNVLTVLGYIGDLFERVFQDRYYHIVEDVGDRYGYDYDKFKYMVDLIQSNYVFQDRDEIIRMVDYLIEALNDPGIILGNKLWRARYETMVGEINRIFNMEPVRMGKILYFEYDGSLYLTSYIGRGLASKYKGYYVLLGVPNFSDKYSQLYLRIDGEPEISFKELILELNRMGFRVGGKDRVIGIFLEKDRYNEAKNHILKKLGV